MVYGCVLHALIVKGIFVFVGDILVRVELCD